jgi:drug/metabolite transporter (DMT)-like permease
MLTGTRNFSRARSIAPLAIFAVLASFGLGEALSLAAALAWAVGVILYKRIGSTVPPFALNLLKNVLVAALLLPTALVVHGLAWPSMGLHSVLLCALSGAIGISIADTMYFKALNDIGAGRIGIIGNLYSPFVVALSYIFLDERLLLLQLLGFVLVLLGVGVVNASPDAQGSERPKNLTHGVVLGIVAILLNAFGIVLVKRVLEVEPFFWAALMRMLGAVLLMLVVFALRPRLFAFDRKQVSWLELTSAAFVGQYLAMLLWLGGYKYTSASIASILNELASVFILILAAIFLGERLDRLKIAGVACTLVGLALIFWP